MDANVVIRLAQDDKGWWWSVKDNGLDVAVDNTIYSTGPFRRFRDAAAVAHIFVNATYVGVLP